nr:E4 SUMO-protein ligase PIAL2 [Tanacetum cinerariifolium]
VVLEKDQEQYWSVPERDYYYIPIKKIAETFRSYRVGKNLVKELSVVVFLTMGYVSVSVVLSYLFVARRDIVMHPLNASTHLSKDLCANIFRLGLDLMYYYSLRLLPLRCFDFDNYVDINSRRPPWRCPLCGQSVCFTDIRIDQGMVKSTTHAVGMTSTSINAMSHGQSRSQFSASNTLQLRAHVIGTSSTIMHDMSHGQSQSKVSASSYMQLPRHTTGHLILFF